MGDYNSMRVLIIEDFANFSASLRSMVMFYGVAYDSIQIAATGEDALLLLQETRYDLVLSDYNLGEGRNGNDVLEEATHNKLLKSACIYIMLTAENSMEMVMGALEYQPNEYLTKPFTKELLNSRIERLLTRRDALMEIYAAIDQEQLAAAITRCNQLASEFPRYQAYLFKLKTDLMMQNAAYAACLDVYSAILKAKFVPWAQLGLGKCHFYLGEYSDAEQAFRTLLDQDKRYVQAWDWLAQVLEKQDDYQASQLAVAEAAKVSPRNVQRQARLGHLAIKNGDLEVAEKAFNQSVKIGKHSVHCSPDNYLELANVLTERVKTAEPEEARRIVLKTTGMLDELRKVYRKDPKVALQSRLSEGKFHKAQGNEIAANQALNIAFELCSKDEAGDIPADLKEHVVTELKQTDQLQLAQELVAGMQREESIYNRKAIELYEEGDLAKALVVLKRAMLEKPRSFAVNLNFAQVALHSMVDNGVDDALMALVGQCFKQVETLSEGDKRFKVLKQLQARYKKMEQG